MNIMALLTAIAMVESGGNDLAVGKGGEVSRYQIAPVTWRSITKEPLSAARDPVVSTKVAMEHVARIRRALPRERRDDVEWVAAAWCWGTAKTVRKATAGRRAGFPAEVEDYAERVRNLYVAARKQK